MNTQQSARKSLSGLRLRKHADYQRAYAAARKYFSPSISWFLAPQQLVPPRIAPSQHPETLPTVQAPGQVSGQATGHATGHATDQTPPQAKDARTCVSLPRVGLTVGKVMGPAHERNRIKRRLREVLRVHAELLPTGFDLILHPRRSVLTMEFVKLESEIVRILTSAQQEAAKALAGKPLGGQPANRLKPPPKTGPQVKK